MSTRHIVRKVTVSDSPHDLTIDWSESGWTATLFRSRRKHLIMEQSAMGRNRERLEELFESGGDNDLIEHVQLVFDFCESVRFEFE